MRDFAGAALLAGMVLPAAGREPWQLEPSPGRLAVSASVGTTGVGAQVTGEILPGLTARAGVTVLPLSISYTYRNAFVVNEGGTHPVGGRVAIPMEAEAEIFNGNVMLDFFPAADSWFHLTAGLLVGGERALTVRGHAERIDVAVEIGDLTIRPDVRGHLEAWIRTRRLKPYAGIGFGRTIPRRRLGFNTELGLMFQGAPTVTTDNAVLNRLADGASEIDELNRFLDRYFRVYPVLKFNLTYRLF